MKCIKYSRFKFWSLFLQMPKHSKINRELLLTTLMQFKEDIKKDFENYSSKIWKRISIELNNVVLPKYLYTIVKYNRHNCHEMLELSSVTSTKTPSRSSSASSFTPIQVTINAEEWEKIKPSSTRTNKKTQLKEGWTHVIFKEIIKYEELNCCWSFKKNSINSTLMIDATGSCVKKLQRPNILLSGHLLLYVGVIDLGYNDGEIPVFQKISEIQNINHVTL